jgi:hypothetical protein
MPIYHESYSVWEGKLKEKPLTWYVIARTGIRLVWTKGLGFLLVLTLIPFLIVIIPKLFEIIKYINNAQLDKISTLFQFDEKTFWSFFRTETYFMVLMIIVTGSGLIANDRRFNAYQIYFSKPLSFFDYILGKFLIVAFYCSLVTLLPSFLLFLLQILLTGDIHLLWTRFSVLLALVGLFLMYTLVWGGVILALSALSKRALTASIFFLAINIFPYLFRLIVPQSPQIALFSLEAVIPQVGSILFHVDKPFGFPVWQGVIVFVLTCLISYWILWWKVRPTEVVK